MSITFGTGGFRAVIGEEFTKENVSKICQSLSNIIKKEGKKKEICIGYDNRFMSENFARWCAEVFASNGIKVELCDSEVSTPVIMYATMINNNDYGLMVTASHNPYIYNGIKVFTKGGKDADVVDTKAIEEEINSITEIPTFEQSFEKNIVSCNYVERYITSIVDLLELKDINSDMPIICDTKHGSTDKELDILFEKMGLGNYKIINRKRDAFFDFEAPAPEENNIETLRKTLLDSKANIGFALDADGDRLAVLDNEGNYIDNNYLLAISYYFLVKYCGKEGDSVKNVATSNLLDIVTNKFGYICHEVPVGFKYISKGLLENNAVIGGESSGGLCIKGHILGKDSLLAIALCLKAMVMMKKSFSEIYKEVMSFANDYHKIIKNKQYSFSSSQKFHIDCVLADKITPKHRYELDKVEYKEYIKIYYKNGNWVLIRFSGTEPVLRIFAEADTEKESMALISDWEELLQLS